MRLRSDAGHTVHLLFTTIRLALMDEGQDSRACWRGCLCAQQPPALGGRPQDSEDFAIFTTVFPLKVATAA